MQSRLYLRPHGACCASGRLALLPCGIVVTPYLRHCLRPWFGIVSCESSPEFTTFPPASCETGRLESTDEVQLLVKDSARFPRNSGRGQNRVRHLWSSLAAFLRGLFVPTRQPFLDRHLVRQPPIDRGRGLDDRHGLGRGGDLWCFDWRRGAQLRHDAAKG